MRYRQMLFKLTPLFLLVLTGCSSQRLSPCRSFECIKSDVCAKTGKAVVWETDATTLNTVDQLLASPLSLDDAVRIALLNNAHLQAIYQELGIAQAELVQAGLFKNPVFDFSYRWTLNQAPGYKIDMGVAQDFLDIFLIPLKRKAAIHNLEQLKLTITEEVLTVAAATQIAFYSLQAAQQNYANYEQLAEMASLAVEFKEKQLEAGNIYDLDLTQSRLASEQAKMMVIQAEEFVVEARESLNALMGLWGCRLCWCVDGALNAIPQEELDLQCVEEAAIASSLSLRKKWHLLLEVAAEYGIEMTTTRFPVFDLGAITERETEGQWNLGPGIALGIPIFDFGLAKSAAARSRLRGLWKEILADAIDIRAGARKARAMLQNARSQASLATEQLIPLSKQITAQTHLRYNAMQLGTFDLLDAKKQEVEMLQQSIIKVRDYWIQKAKLTTLLDGVLYENN